RVAEEQAPLARERQHAADRAALLGAEEVGAMAERFGNHHSPGGTVEERGLGAAGDERVPALHVRRVGVPVELAHVHGRAWCANLPADASARERRAAARPANVSRRSRPPLGPRTHPMNPVRNLLLAGSRNAWLQRQATRRRFVKLAVRRFMPGETLDEALAAALEQNRLGIAVTLTHLGENVSDRA